MYPELQEEVAMIEATMLGFAEQHAQEPPPGLQDKIWNAIQVAQQTSENQPAEHKPRLIPLQPEYRKQPLQWKYAAVWVGLIGSLAGNVFLFQQNNNHEQDKGALSLKMDSLVKKQELLAGQLDEFRNAKNMMADTAIQTIVMHTMVKGHPMAATLYWSKDKGDAYVAMDALPMPPKGMQYQLWVIQGGKPVDMGMLPNDMVNSPMMQKVKMQVTNGEAFAISLEKQGGNPTPTTVYVLGKA
jgi:hypothetical protein